MPGGLSKLGRSGGKRSGSGAGGLRNRGSFPPPQQRTPSVNDPSRQRQSTTSCGGKAAPEPEETLSLVPGKNPPAFAMIIRLAPGLVEEIGRLEEQRGTARIKFDAFSKNTSGNVINVGGKEFKFTWSHELGALCDIYEECQSGDDGNRMLVDSGFSSRKLNVQRILDESTTNHVKMRSAEAARKAKSRKTIALDARSPSLMKQLSVAEANACSQTISCKQKNEPPLKRRKVDPPQDKSLRPVVVGLASTSVKKGSLSKSYSSNEDTAPNSAKNNEISVGAVRDSLQQINNAVRKKAEQRANFSGRPNDLQDVLINLLKEAPMSLKALEKAVADVIPDPAKKIEKILKNIATIRTPGRYFLKPGLDLQGVKKTLSGTGRALILNLWRGSTRKKKFVQEIEEVMPSSHNKSIQRIEAKLDELNRKFERFLEDEKERSDRLESVENTMREILQMLKSSPGQNHQILPTSVPAPDLSAVDRAPIVESDGQIKENNLRADSTDAVSQEVELVDAIQRGGSKDYRECQKESPVSAPQQQGAEQGAISHSACGADTSNAVLELGDGIGQKERETSLDEEELFYWKYEKEKPEPKGPINGVSQYKEYAQEYRDKYKSYDSLRRDLLDFSNEFQKLQEDLQLARSKEDMHSYDEILEQLKKLYPGIERHKRLRKIFIVFHAELKLLKQRIEDFASSYEKAKTSKQVAGSF